MCTTTHMLIEEDTLVDPGYDEIMQRIETYDIVMREIGVVT